MIRFQIVSIFAFVALFMMVSCKRTENQYYPDGKLMQQSEYRGKKMHGRTILYYNSGPVMQQLYYQKGLIDGKVSSWYANGVLKSEENFSNGKKAGLARYWDDLGNLTEEKNFIDNTLHGKYLQWFTENELKVEGWFNNGQIDSVWNFYSDNGFKVGEGNFSKGKGIVTGYDELGRTIRITHYSNSKKNGTELIIGPAGDTIQTLEYVNDKMM